MSVETDQTLKTTLRLVNKRGLHARASHKFVECAEQFDALIEVASHNNVSTETVVADSVMELLLLGAAFGEDITITASGSDAQLAIAALSTLVNSKFGENE